MNSPKWPQEEWSFRGKNVILNSVTYKQKELDNAVTKIYIQKVHVHTRLNVTLYENSTKMPTSLFSSPLLPIKRSRQTHQLSASFFSTSQLILPEFRHISATELTSPANFLVLSLVIIPQVHPLPFCLYLESSGLSLVFLFIRSKDFWVSFIF